MEAQIEVLEKTYKDKKIRDLTEIANNDHQIVGWKVDTQEDFMNDGSRNDYKGKLAIKDALKIAGTIAKVERTLRMYQVPILGSMDWHGVDSHEFPEEGNNPDFSQTYPAHCVAGTYGSNFIKEAAPRNPLFIEHDKNYNLEELTEKIVNHEGEVIFRKDAFDVFSSKGNKYAKDIVRNLDVKSAFVYGVALEVCNDFAVKGLLEEGIEVYAISDAMKAINEDVRESVFDTWKELGASIITSDDLYSVLNHTRSSK